MRKRTGRRLFVPSKMQPLQTFFTIQDESVPSLCTYIDVKWDPIHSEVVLKVSVHNRTTGESQYETVPLHNSKNWTVRDVLTYLGEEYAGTHSNSSLTQEEMLDTKVVEVPLKDPHLSILI